MHRPNRQPILVLSALLLGKLKAYVISRGWVGCSFHICGSDTDASLETSILLWVH